MRRRMLARALRFILSFAMAWPTLALSAADESPSDDDLPPVENQKPLAPPQLYRAIGPDPTDLRDRYDQRAYSVRPNEIVPLSPETARGPEGSQSRVGEVWTSSGGAARVLSDSVLADERAFAPLDRSSPFIAHVEIGEGGAATLFDSPGFSSEVCSSDKARCLGAAANGAKLTVVGAQLMRMTELGGRVRLNNFYMVSIPGDRGKKPTIAWIEASAVKPGAAPPRPPPKPPASEDCPPAGSPGVPLTPSAIAALASKSTRAAANAIGDSLLPDVGACLTTPKELRAGAPHIRSSAYSERLEPHWMQRTAAGVPAHADMSGAPLSSDRIACIDALARTLYAEVANCAATRPQYLTAVGAIVLNRMREMRVNPVMRTVYAREQLSPACDGMMDVIFSPYQFSEWNPRTRIPNPELAKYRARRKKKRHDKPPPPFAFVNNGSLNVALCPPSPNRPDDRGPRVPDAVRVWQQAVRIATHMTLAPDEFAKRTSIRETDFTSGMGESPQGYPPAGPRLADGQPIDDPNCMEIWARPKTSASK